MSDLSVFKARIADFRDPKRLPPFCVLVWGPAPGDSPEAKKRVEIRDELKKQTPPFEVAFSEELAKEGENVSHDEFHHVRAADLVVILRSSFGSTAELHEFGLLPGIPEKLMVWVDKNHGSGFSSKGIAELLQASHNCVYQYTQDDLAQCCVLKKTIECATARRLIKQRQAELR